MSREITPAVTRYPDGKNHMHNYALYITHAHELSKCSTLTVV